MANAAHFPVVEAVYTPQALPEYQGNPLIEALGPHYDVNTVVRELTVAPAFSATERDAPTDQRLHMLRRLHNFMVPTQANLNLFQRLDTLIRRGYVGRRPYTAESIARHNAAYRRRVSGTVSQEHQDYVLPVLSSTLLGLPGTGKTTTVRRSLAPLPRVIHHPTLGVYQVPYLHVQVPSDGKSVKAFAHAVLRQLDELVPGHDYLHHYAIKGRPGADALMHSVASVLQAHFVGLLVCDEIQNLANSPKGEAVLMSEITSACNDLQVPLLVVGTNQAQDVLFRDMRQCRRTIGCGYEYFDRLNFTATGSTVSEWEAFMTSLWCYQWVRKPAELNPTVLRLFYDYSQGIIDLAIKLFAACQAQAMVDESETLSLSLIHAVYEREFAPAHAMLDALRRGDQRALRAFPDLKPLSLNVLLDRAALQSHGKTLIQGMADTDPREVAARVASTLQTAAGVDAELAMSTAEDLIAQGKAPNAPAGVREALKLITPPKRPRGKQVEEIAAMDFSNHPLDYRRAIAEAAKAGTTVFAQMKKLGMAPSAEAAIPL
jgi:hypothetical protein